MPKLIKIGLPTCGPCRVLEKNLKESGIEYESLDAAQDDEIVNLYNVTTVPTLVLIDDNGRLLAKHTGILSPDGIKEFVNGTY